VFSPNTSKAEITHHAAIDHLSKVYVKFLNLPLGMRMASSTAI